MAGETKRIGTRRTLAVVPRLLVEGPPGGGKTTVANTPPGDADALTYSSIYEANGMFFHFLGHLTQTPAGDYPTVFDTPTIQCHA
jgi:hypothetical protein